LQYLIAVAISDGAISEVPLTSAGLSGSVDGSDAVAKSEIGRLSADWVIGGDGQREQADAVSNRNGTRSL
jgi:hypothetical protein